MRTFNMVLEVPDDYNYADEILYMMACEFGAQAGINVRIAPADMSLAATALCSVCGGTPAVNVSGTYWLCGACVLDKLFDYAPETADVYPLSGTK